MKLLALATFTLALAAGAQTTPKAQPVHLGQAAVATAPTATSEHSELLLTKLKLAISQAQISQLSIQQIPQVQQAQHQAEAAQALVETTQRELGLDASYRWDWQSQAFVKAAPAAPAPVPATSTKK